MLSLATLSSIIYFRSYKICYFRFVILQASTQKKYPYVLLAVMYQTGFSAIMAAIFALIVANDASAWKLKLDMGLVSILYTVRSKAQLVTSYYINLLK